MRKLLSKVTAQGQISVPAEVRRKLGIQPGSTLEWEEVGDTMVVRKSGRYTSLEVHRALFGNDGAPVGAIDVDEGIRTYIRRQHGRR